MRLVLNTLVNTDLTLQGWHYTKAIAIAMDRGKLKSRRK